ncbi:MAG: glycerol-3-phosphate 1-O-acyltransferase PlsY [Alphaproteobacteria bacterium]|nr:glycerol-3-phosphate 1-O-acyltransferase PlsY [Alphaproteobacteria bacterium]
MGGDGAGALGPVLAALLGGYLLGSIPFGLLLTRAAGLGDIRDVGSGNIGATNVLRTGRKGIAAATLLLDAAKGVAAVLLAARFGDVAALAAGAGAVLGHVFPVWLGFRGGKGVATTYGVMIAACWPAAVVALLVWAAVAALSRYSSLAALVSMASLPALAWMFSGPFLSMVAAALALLVIVRHNANIVRLWQGTELRIGRRKG